MCPLCRFFLLRHNKGVADPLICNRVDVSGLLAHLDGEW
jgi:hypothetical protein